MVVLQKKSSHLSQSLPPSLPPPPYRTRCHAPWGQASVVGPHCLWIHLDKALLVMFGLGTAIERTRKHYKKILLCGRSSSVSGETALLGMKNVKMKNDMSINRNWTDVLALICYILHLPPLKNLSLYSGPAAGFQYGKVGRNPREIDPVAPHVSHPTQGT